MVHLVASPPPPLMALIKTDTTKSKFKYDLEKVMERVVGVTPYFYVDQNIHKQLVFVDLMLCLRNIRTDRIRTYGDVVWSFRCFVYHLYRRGISALILLIDRSGYVHVGKQEEWDKREKQQKKYGRNVSLGVFVPPDVFNYDTPFPPGVEFEDMILDRSSFRPWFIKMLCFELMFGKARIELTGDSNIVQLFGIYGHNIPHEMIPKEFILSCNRASFPSNTEDHLLLLESLPTGGIALSAPVFMIRGEADFMPYRILLKFKENYPRLTSFELISSDADWLICGLIFVNDHGKSFPDGAVWSFDHGLYGQINNCRGKRYSLYLNPQKRVDLNMLASDLKMALPEQKYPVQNLAITFMMGGCDYTYGIKGITHENLVNRLVLDRWKHDLFIPPDGIDRREFSIFMTKALTKSGWTQKPDSIPEKTMEWDARNATYYLKILLQLYEEEIDDPLLLDDPAVYGYYRTEDGKYYRKR